MLFVNNLLILLNEFIYLLKQINCNYNIMRQEIQATKYLLPLSDSMKVQSNLFITELQLLHPVTYPSEMQEPRIKQYPGCQIE